MHAQAILSGSSDVRAGALTEVTLQMAADLLPPAVTAAIDLAELAQQAESAATRLNTAGAASPAKRADDSMGSPTTRLSKLEELVMKHKQRRCVFVL